ncbi:MAG: hypothetical protein NT067_00555 [Candidatus Diapherotrites archaeon]|nr:hypothetical protein [Candidatus Diapherotrites archaeon]
MKKLFSIVLFAGICLALSSSAAAFDESHVITWDNVYLVKEMTVPVTVKNTSLLEKELEVQFIGPAGLHYSLSKIPEKIGEMESVSFDLTIYPSDETEGTTYNSALMVSLGDTTVLKEIKVHSAKQFPAGTETSGGENGSTGQANGAVPMILLGGLEGAAMIVLLAVVILLSIAIIAKILSMKSRQEREFYE